MANKTERKINKRLLLGLILGALAWGCKKDEVSKPGNWSWANRFSFDLQSIPNYAQIDYPVHFTRALNTDNEPANNVINNKQALLGRVLFYDSLLSLNNTISCASCHKQALGFTDSAQFSRGFEGGKTGMHSMRLVNGRFYAAGFQFWDRRAESLEVQVLHPIQDALEMGFTAEHGGLEALEGKLSQTDYYPPFFEFAFGSAEVTSERMALAMAQFIRSMVSVRSKFDKGFEGVYDPFKPGLGLTDPFSNFSPEENEGKRLFMTPVFMGGAGCNDCHQAPAFTLDQMARSNGLDAGETRVFKSPSLSEVAIGGPYMHDGRFETLHEVVEHYNSGIKFGPALDHLLHDEQEVPIKLGLKAKQINDLVAFLHTLSDDSFLTDEKFSNPFK